MKPVPFLLSRVVWSIKDNPSSVTLKSTTGAEEEELLPPTPGEWSTVLFERGSDVHLPVQRHSQNYQMMTFPPGTTLRGLVQGLSAFYSRILTSNDLPFVRSLSGDAFDYKEGMILKLKQGGNPPIVELLGDATHFESFGIRDEKLSLQLGS